MSRFAGFDAFEKKVLASALYEEADSDDPDEEIQEYAAKAEELYQEVQRSRAPS